MNKIILSSLILPAFLFADTMSDSAFLEATNHKSKNAYTAVIPIDLVKDIQSSEWEPKRYGYDPHYRRRNWDEGRSHSYGLRENTEVMIIGNVTLGFQLREYHYDWENGLPLVHAKNDKATVGMVISYIDPSLSKFKVDLRVKSTKLVKALSDPDDSTITSRYTARFVSCDGEALSFGTRSDNIRDIVADLAGEDFAEYQGCHLKLTWVASDLVLAHDPYRFTSREDKRKTPRSSSELIQDFDLQVGAHGKASLTTSKVVTAAGLFPSEKSRKTSFTLKATAFPTYGERETILELARQVALGIVGYADDLIQSAAPDDTQADRDMTREAALSKQKAALTANIKSLRSQFGELTIEDQFQVLSIVGRAYYYADQIKADLKDIKEVNVRANLDVK